MRRVDRALLRAGASASSLPAPPASAVPRVLAGWPGGDSSACSSFARGGRASSSAAPTGWAASVLEHTARQLHAARDEDEDDELADEDEVAFRRRRGSAPPLDDDDDELEEEEEEAPPPRAPPPPIGSGNRLIWPPPPDVLRDNPARAEVARLPAAARATRAVRPAADAPRAPPRRWLPSKPRFRRRRPRRGACAFAPLSRLCCTPRSASSP